MNVAGNVPAPSAADGQLVLVVDDSQIARRSMRHILEKAGFVVREACNGMEGLELACALEPACITLDILMPGIDGLELIEQLRARGVQVPVVVVTADIQASTRARCMDHGAFGILSKPVRPAEARALVEEATSHQTRQNGPC